MAGEAEQRHSSENEDAIKRKRRHKNHFLIEVVRLALKCKVHCYLFFQIQSFLNVYSVKSFAIFKEQLYMTRARNKSFIF